MAKGKGGNKTKKIGYVSKGERNSIDRKLVNLMRRERRAEFNPFTHAISVAKKTMVIERPQNKTEKEVLKPRYEKEFEAVNLASPIFEKYKICGMTWGAALMAAKTGKIPELTNKWSPVLSEFYRKQKEVTKTSRQVEREKFGVK